MGKEPVITNQTEKISEYLRLTREIDKLESNLSGKENELRNKFSSDYAKLKRELGGYIAKIKQTVETVCNLYKNKVQLSNGKMYLAGVGAIAQRYTALNAYEVAISAGNEGIKLLSAIIGRVSVDVNLREFAIRYNTVVDIYGRAEALQGEAISASLGSYKSEIDSLKNKCNALCKNKNEFDELVGQVISNSRLLYNKAIIDDRLELENEFKSEISIPLGYDACDGSKLGRGGNNTIILSLLEWELHKDGIALIRGSGADISTRALARVVVNSVMKFLFAYPGTSKQILLCDSYSNDEITTFAGILKNGNVGLFFDSASGSFVKNSDEDIRTAISELNRIINERIMLLGQSKCDNILEYNKKNQDNPQPIILAALNGYPSKYENSCDEMFSTIKNGKKAGVFFLITENTDQDEESKYYLKRLPKLEELTKNIIELKKGYLYKNGKSYFSNTCGKNYNISSVLSVFKTSVKSVENKIIYLDSVVGKEDFASSARRKKYSKTLSIPIGKQGANPITVDLNANGPDAHLAIIGTTGSGKTAFIDSLVLSACKLYSPEELELHLIVMVKGDFKIFEEQGLPHLKTVVTGDRIFAANDVLDFIDEEMTRRGNLIGSYGNIYAYNEVAKEPLPRCVIVIDEFYQLVAGSDDAIDRINRIAQVGRAYGISLVISSIRFPMEVNSIIPLFGNRIEFKSEENAGQLIPQVANRQSELEATKGLCFFSHSGNLQSVRVAYSEEGEKLKAHISEVKSKYPDCKMELQSEIKAIKVSRETDVPFTVRRAKSNYDEEGVIRTRLGKTYLSNRALEYSFDSKNNTMFLFGHYLETKMLEASLIKDTLVLSKDVEEPTVYYIDYNKNANLKRAKTVIKAMRDSWVMSGKMVYSTSDEAEDTLEEIKGLINARQEDEESALYPVLVVIARADEIFEDDDMCESLCELITKGKENNIYFAIQCNEPVSFYGSDKFVNDAIIFPDRYSEGDDSYASTALCTALEAMPAGSTDKGRKLISNATISALHPKLHLLCDNNKISIFIPYEYDENYLKNIVD